MALCLEKKLMIFTFLVVATMGTGSCDNGGVNRSLRITAQNVVLGSANTNSKRAAIFSQEAAATEDIDTTTKVLAENVVLDNASTSLQSDNVQSAFEETDPDLTAIIAGTWKVTTYLDNTGEKVEGTITFDLDGTVSHTGDVRPFGALGTETIKSWSIQESFVLQLTRTDDYIVNITFSKLTANTLIVANPIYTAAAIIQKNP